MAAPCENNGPAKQETIARLKALARSSCSRLSDERLEKLGIPKKESVVQAEQAPAQVKRRRGGQKVARVIPPPSQVATSGDGALENKAVSGTVPMPQRNLTNLTFEAGGGLPSTASFQIPEKLASTLQQHEGIRCLEQASGAAVQLVPRGKNSKHQEILLVGTPSNVENAKRLMTELLQAFGYAPSSRYKGMESAYMEVPKLFLPYILGQEGQAARRVCERNGVKTSIDMDREVMSQNARLVGPVCLLHLKGSPKGVALAYQCFEMALAQCYQRHGWSQPAGFDVLAHAMVDVTQILLN